MQMKKSFKKIDINQNYLLSNFKKLIVLFEITVAYKNVSPENCIVNNFQIRRILLFGVPIKNCQR